MRVLKGNNIKYASFHKSLPTLTKQYSGNKPNYLQKNAGDETGYEALSELTRFVSLLNGADTIQKVNHILLNSIRGHVTFVEGGFFFFDSNNTGLVSPDNTLSADSGNFVNNAYKEGILDWAFSSRAPRSIPVYRTYTLQESDSQCLIIPLFEAASPKGIFSLIHNSVIDTEGSTASFIQLVAGYAFQRISLLMTKEETKHAYNSLQAYQSKLSNDYRLFAVGELAGGVLEEILDPLQVIFTSVDLLNTTNGNKEIVAGIKNNVRKIEASAERLRKFADRNVYSSIKIVPCDLNKILENYYSIISSSLEKKQIECILDLEKGLPSILTNSDLINQLMVNIFSMITSDFTKTGGILIQTQLVRDVVKLSIVTTETINNKKDAHSVDPNYKIILQLVKKHEGDIEIKTNAESGSKIEIRFPLKRKIRS